MRASMNLKELKELIELVSEKGFAEFEIERQGFRLRISRFKEPTTQVIHPATAPVIISPAISAPHGLPVVPTKREASSSSTAPQQSTATGTGLEAPVSE